MELAAVRAALEALVSHVELLARSPAPDGALAERAARNLRDTLATVNGAHTPAEEHAAVERVRYDVSGKGLHDWTWSPQAAEALQQHSARVRQALDAAAAGFRSSAP